MPDNSDSKLKQSIITDDVSRRGLVTGAAVVAALGGTVPEALAQRAAPSGGPANLHFIKPTTTFNNPAFSHGVEAIGPGRIVFVAGQQGLGLDGKAVPGDFLAQAEQAFVNIKNILAASGAGMEHIVRLNHYFLDLKSDFKTMRDLRLKYFDAARMPASTMIQVGALTNEGVVYEIDAVAVVPQG